MARGSAVATDDFNRASLGANWTQFNHSNASDMVTASSTYVVGSVAAAFTGTGPSGALWAGAGSFNNDQWAGIVVSGLSNLGPNFVMGAAVRASGADTTRSFYGAVVCYTASSGGTGDIKLVKVVNGTGTQLATASGTIGDGMRIEIEAEGTTIRACVNGTPIGGIFTVTDSAIASGAPGILGSDATHGDDWQAGNFVTGGFLARNFWWDNL